MTFTTDVRTYICVRLTLCVRFFFLRVLTTYIYVNEWYVVRTSYEFSTDLSDDAHRSTLYVNVRYWKLSINVRSTYALKIFNWRKRCFSIRKWMVSCTYVILILNWRKRWRTSLYVVLHKASPYVNVYTIAYWFVQRKYVVYIRTSYVDIVCFGMCMGVMLRFVFA
jgi:hypothetical protein